MIKSGSTYILLIDIPDLDVSLIDSIIFTLKNQSRTSKLIKTYPETVSYSNGYFSIPLSQENTTFLYSKASSIVVCEGQINYKNKSVGKTDLKTFDIEESLNTVLIEGNTPSSVPLESIKFSVVGDVIIAEVSGELPQETIEKALKDYLDTHALPYVTPSEMEEYVENEIPAYIDSHKDELKGDPGAPGEKGDPFRYEDFTPEQLASLKGEKGDDGYTPQKGVDYFDGKDGVDGTNGKDGVDGFSPSAKVERIIDGAKITITDKSGTTSAIINDGQGGGGTATTDKTLTIEDMPADAKAVGDAFKETVNLLLSDEKIVGKSIKNWGVGTTTDEDLLDNASYTTYPKVYGVEVGKTYSLYRNDGLRLEYGVVGFYNADGKLIKLGTPTNITIPQGCTHIRFCENNSSVDIIAVKEGVDARIRIIPYGEKADKYAYKKDIIKMNYLYVSTSGNDESGDGSLGFPYKTIYKANDSIVDNGINNRYTIIVQKGTYSDLEDLYRGVGHTGTYQGVICKDYVYYESENINEPQDTIISWDGAVGLTNPTRNDIVDKCPFHVSTPNVHTHIKGFKFVVKNARYCFHGESSGQGGNSEWLVSDCIFEWGGCPDCTDDNGTVPAIGIGVSVNEKITIMNSKIISTTPSGFMTHDGKCTKTISGTKAFLNGARIKVIDCDFGNTSVQIQSSYPRSIDRSAQNHNVLEFNNCIGITRVYGYQSPSTNPSGIVLWRIKNEISEIATNDMSQYTY